MNSDLLGDDWRVRGISLRDEDGGRRLDDCVVNCYGFFGACNGNSDCSIAGTECTWETGAALNIVGGFCSWFVEAGTGEWE